MKLQGSRASSAAAAGQVARSRVWLRRTVLVDKILLQAAVVAFECTEFAVLGGDRGGRRQVLRLDARQRTAFAETAQQVE